MSRGFQACHGQARRLHVWLAAWVLATSAIGCTDRPPAVVPVSGCVTLDGKPLANCVVVFQPVTPEADASGGGSSPSAMGSSGRTDAEGRFVLTLIDPDIPGAIPGTHVVTLTTATTASNDAARPTGERVPLVWRNGSKTYDVPKAGTQSADFLLESK